MINLRDLIVNESHVHSDFEKKMDSLAVSVVEHTSYKDWQTEAIEKLMSGGTNKSTATKMVSEWSTDTLLNYLTSVWKEYWKQNPIDFEREYESHFGQETN